MMRQQAAGHTTVAEHRRARRTAKLRQRLARAHQQSVVPMALGSIQRVEAKIHRIRLSGNYTYQEIEQAIGRMKVVDQFDHENRQRGYQQPKYRNRAYLQMEEKHLTVFFDRSEPFLPRCIIETSEPTKTTLRRLAEGLPGLKVSKQEHASDLIIGCDEEVVGILYRALLRYVYVPYARNAISWHDRLTSGTTRMNCTFAVVGKMRLYERGPEELKNGRGWDREDLDRVRLEKIVRKRKDQEPSKLILLEDLVENGPGLVKTAESFEFKKFAERSRGLPKEWEGYHEKDRNGNCGAFMLEHLANRSRVANIWKATEKSRMFNQLKEMLITAAENFEHSWKEHQKNRTGLWQR